jgi:hypothetical protein
MATQVNNRNFVTPQHATRSEGFPKGSKYD